MGQARRDELISRGIKCGVGLDGSGAATSTESLSLAESIPAALYALIEPSPLFWKELADFVRFATCSQDEDGSGN